MSIEIICPLYNAENYLINLNNSFIMQKKVNIKKITYMLTESKDNTEEILKENNMTYEKIKRGEFSHSLTREKPALKSDADIICFVTQDVQIEDDLWLYHLTKNIGKNNIVASYSRQVTKFNNIEKYTRESNYPDKDIVKSKDDIETLGLKTFFFSDAASAIKKDVFVSLNGYDGKNLPTNEDMYIAYKIIMAGYKISYESKSVVYHSHNFKLKELYKRYKDTGVFFKQNSYLDQYGTTGSGAKLAKYVLKRIIKEHRIGLLFRYPFDMAARLFGMKAGKR